MKEYIERELVNKLLNDHLDNWWGPEYYATSIIKDEIDCLPSAEVVEALCAQAVHVDSDIEYEDTLIRMDRQCGRCGALITSVDSYCPSCGAYMIRR